MDDGANLPTPNRWAGRCPVAAGDLAHRTATL